MGYFQGSVDDVVISDDHEIHARVAGAPMAAGSVKTFRTPEFLQTH